MAFKKGLSGNPNGKAPGTKNKLGNHLRETIANFLSENFEQISRDFKELPAKDRTKLYIDLLQFGLPKLQAMSNDIQFESLTDEQLEEIIQKLKVA